VKALAGVGALVAITLGLSTWLAGPSAAAAHAAGAPTWPLSTSSSVLARHGRLRCTATVRSQVPVGQTLTVRFTVHNISKRAASAALWFNDPAFTLKAADGTVYNSTDFYKSFIGIPPSVPKKLRPGATLHQSINATVRWRGPLQITPGCLGKTLPTLRVREVAAWPRPNESTAVSRVVAAAGHLLDHCRPQTSGVPVDGQIYPPSGTAPPLDARCSVAISADGPFLLAQVLVLTPPGLTGMRVYQPYELLWPLGPPPGAVSAAPPFEAIAWEFVVTRENAVPVAASSVAATKPSSSVSVPTFDWSHTGWQPQGYGSCGGTGYTWGGTGPEIEFISACPA
jgi:hypothetical protein